MDLIPGIYEYDAEENFYDFLVASGAPAEKARQSVNRKSAIEVTVNGAKIAFKSDSGHVSILVVGEEVEEKLPTLTFKSTTQVEGNTLTVRSIKTFGTNEYVGLRLYKFSKSGLVLTLKSTLHEKVAIITYKRL